LKRDFETIFHDRTSLMPAYTEQMISAAELQDLLAYMESLRGE
jgi:hypothetical protein